MNDTTKDPMSAVEREKTIFRCKMCGHCCHGESTVSMAEWEQQRIADRLGISVSELLERYCVVLKNRVEMKIVDGHCIFYGADGRCQIHEVKPFPCKQWPLHPSILGDPKAWEAIYKDCPGFKKGLTYEEVSEWLKQKIKDKEGASE